MAALSNLLNLPEGDKTARGLLHTPQEIAQQPATWESTFGRFQNRHTVIREFLREAGVSGDPRQIKSHNEFKYLLFLFFP